MDFLLFLAYVILALFDLIALEIILSLIFTIDERGRIKYTFNHLFKKGRSKPTWMYVLTVIFLGVIYFFLANIYQDAITNIMITYFGYYLILLLISSLSLVTFWIVHFYVGRKLTSWPVLALLIIFIVSVVELISVLIIRSQG
jgi:hypothetical protein